MIDVGEKNKGPGECNLTYDNRKRYDKIQQKLEQLVEEKKEAKKRKGNLPPVAGDLDSLAAMQDMDLSSLMREISRR